MKGPGLFLIAVVVAAPVLAYFIYRVAKDLGFLDPPLDRQHELRRQILAALYALLLFLPIFLFGWERRWPRVWIAFGVVSGLALVFFAASGFACARTLWKLRHHPPVGAPAPAEADPAAGNPAQPF